MGEGYGRDGDWRIYIKNLIEVIEWVVNNMGSKRVRSYSNIKNVYRMENKEMGKKRKNGKKRNNSRWRKEWGIYYKIDWKEEG